MAKIKDGPFIAVFGERSQLQVGGYQLVGGPGGYYHEQNDRCMVQDAPALSEQSLTKLFAAVNNQMLIHAGIIAGNRLEGLTSETPAEFSTLLHKSGSTGLLAYSDGGDNLITAHLGDTRATLYAYRPHKQMVMAHQLTIDHSTKNEDEVARVLATGASKLRGDGKYFQDAGTPDEGSALACARNFGCTYFDHTWLIQEPEVNSFNLRDPLFDIRDTDIVFLAAESDGVHLTRPPEERTEPLLMAIDQGKLSLQDVLHRPDKIANHFGQAALARRSRDNMTCMITRLDTRHGQPHVVGVFDGCGESGYKVSDFAANAFSKLIAAGP